MNGNWTIESFTHCFSSVAAFFMLHGMGDKVGLASFSVLTFIYGLAHRKGSSGSRVLRLDFSRLPQLRALFEDSFSTSAFVRNTWLFRCASWSPCSKQVISINGSITLDGLIKDGLDSWQSWFRGRGPSNMITNEALKGLVDSRESW